MGSFCPLIPGGETMTPPITSLHVRLLAGRFNTGNREIELTGRMAWALSRLVDAGKAGCTPITEPAGPRWAAYIFKLRGLGLDIATHHVPHDGDFAGCHGKYILQSEIEVIPEGVAA